MFLVCETSEVASDVNTTRESQDSDVQSRRRIALSDNSDDDVEAAPGSGAQLGAAATPPVTPVSFHHNVLDDPYFEQEQLHCGVHTVSKRWRKPFAWMVIAASSVGP